MKISRTTNATTRLTAVIRRPNGGGTAWPKTQTGKILFAALLVSLARLVLACSVGPAGHRGGRLDGSDLEIYRSDLNPDVKSPPI